jgi:arylsulfatase A-like enzyme
VLGVPVPYTVGVSSGTDHASPYTYDTHVPLAFYGLPFQPGTYRSHAEPVDLAATLASLLGINAPSHAIGRVLTEALPASRRASTSSHGSERDERSAPSVGGRGFQQGAIRDFSRGKTFTVPALAAAVPKRDLPVAEGSR